MFIPTAELVIPTGIQNHEANTDIELQSAVVEDIISKCST